MLCRSKVITVFRFALSGLATLFISCNSGNDQEVTGIHYKTLKPVSVSYRNGIIKDVRELRTLPAGSDSVYISPGLIDNQVNGFAGVSFTFGGSNLTPGGLLKATRELWKAGVTTYLPTLTTNDTAVLLHNFRILAASVNDSSLQGSIPGYHLEGPFISPENGFRGAHPLKHVIKPDWGIFEKLQKSAEGKILQVTVAPETEGALEFIAKASSAGIVVGLGHHNGSSEQVNEAVEKGALIATHLGNGCANMINRHLNPLWPQLANGKLMVSLIADGFHLNKDELKVFYKVKGSKMVILTSDVTAYASLEPGIFINQEGDTLELTRDGMVRVPSQGVLAGSASPLSRGIGFFTEATGAPLHEAIDMATVNPAKLYRLEDRGVLEKGKRADIIAFKIQKGNMTILKTVVKGIEVYSGN
jgi:N-acetylglucosamine-6-phosphate deacetylase